MLRAKRERKEKLARRSNEGTIVGKKGRIRDEKGETGNPGIKDGAKKREEASKASARRRT